MAFVVGVLLALSVGLLATIIGLDRERGFYTTLMLVIAALYSLFAVMGGSTQALLLEIAAGTIFVALAVAGWRSSLWIVVLALAGHGFFDFVHAKVIADPGVPAYWPAFCGAYDVTAAAYLAVILKAERVQAVRT